jgi:hypothetical protein
MRGRRIGAAAAFTVASLAWVPGAALGQDGAVAETPVEFTGAITCGDMVRPETAEAGAGVTMNRGGAWNPVAVTMSDPRLAGDYYISFDSDVYTDGSSVGTGTWRIQNDDGAWQGSYNILGVGDRGAVVTTPLVGEGAYDGLTAIWESTFDPLSCVWEVWGLISTSPLPAAPEPFLSD